MFKKVILIGRENCKSTKRVLKFLKKKSKKVLFYETSFQHKKKNFKQNVFSNCDFIFSFRGLYILTKQMLESPRFGAINFHAGPPEYRGAGAINFSMNNREKSFGCTAHIMNQKIDSGAILGVTRFKINKNHNLEKIIRKLHLAMEKQAIDIIKKLLKDPKNLTKMISKNKKIKWAKKLYTLKDLNKFKMLDINLTKSAFDRKIFLTSYKNYKPYIIIKKRKFVLAD